MYQRLACLRRAAASDDMGVCWLNGTWLERTHNAPGGSAFPQVVRLNNVCWLHLATTFKGVHACARVRVHVCVCVCVCVACVHVLAVAMAVVVMVAVTVLVLTLSTFFARVFCCCCKRYMVLPDSLQ